MVNSETLRNFFYDILGCALNRPRSTRHLPVVPGSDSDNLQATADHRSSAEGSESLGMRDLGEVRLPPRITLTL